MELFCFTRSPFFSSGENRFVFQETPEQPRPAESGPKGEISAETFRMTFGTRAAEVTRQAQGQLDTVQFDPYVEVAHMFGIQTNGRSTEDIRSEVDTEVRSAAEFLGLNADKPALDLAKDIKQELDASELVLREVRDEIMANRVEEADALNRHYEEHPEDRRGQGHIDVDDLSAYRETDRAKVAMMSGFPDIQLDGSNAPTWGAIKTKREQMRSQGGSNPRIAQR